MVAHFVLRSEWFALEQLLVGFDDQLLTSVSICVTSSNTARRVLLERSCANRMAVAMLVQRLWAP